MPSLNGSPLSCEEILNRYGPLVYRMAIQGTGSVADGEDVAQEVFVSLIQRRTIPLEDARQAAPPPEEGGTWEAVAALPSKYRWPVYLHYIEGYTAAEIAQLLGCPRNTVLSRLSRAREKLKDALKEEWA